MTQKLHDQKFDEIDRRILSSLQEDARMTNVELAEAAGLSPAACLRRVRELQASGVIRRYVTLLDPKMLGARRQCFCPRQPRKSGREGA
jgi:Lrp/AsnC family transcriptional regulator, leucine-responsive regulatory protein